MPQLGGSPSVDASERREAFERASRVDEIPVLLAEPERWLNQLKDGDADAPFDQLSYGATLALSRYLPQLVRPEAPLRQAVREMLTHAPVGAALAVEFGCSVGPDLRALREVAAHVVGFDVYLPALRAARAQLAGASVPLHVRVEGRKFEVGEPIALPAVDGVTLVVGDAQDPPLVAACADVVLAMNVLDNVARPNLALSQMLALLRPGGLLVLGTPFAWQDAITPFHAQLGGAPESEADDTPSVLAELLGPEMEILARSDVPWVLRDHARAEFHYLVHLVAARKLG